jgi:hypothetical protein
MQQTENPLPPVLTLFHDQVLYLNHNLNAASIASLNEISARLINDTFLNQMSRSN